MAKFEDLSSPIWTGNQSVDIDTTWNGHTGQEVEDYITRSIEDLENNDIVNGTYEDEMLSLVKKDGSKVEINVTVQQPTYAFGIYIYGLKVNDKLILRGQDLQTIQYTKDKTYQLGIAMYATADTTVRSNRVGPFSVKVNCGSSNKVTYSVQNISYEYFSLDDSGKVASLNIPDGEDVNTVVKWVDISDVFTTSQEGASITATIVADKEVVSTVTLTDTFTTPVTIQVISLSYKGATVVNSNVINFTLSGANVSNYMLEAYNQDGVINIDTTQTTLNCPLNAGLNQIIARAVNKNDSSIYTDWAYVDVICTLDCTETVVAINGVTNGIRNNSIAELYNITVYSPNNEDITLVTYLSENDPGSGEVNPDESDQLKTQTITSSDYDEDHIYEISYYKYIESKNSTASNRYLMVKVGNSFYAFVNYDEYSEGTELSYFKVMPVSAVNYNYCYYNTGVLHSFDQLTAYLNDVFVTKEYASIVNKNVTVSDTLESSDGWKEDKGVVYFKVSAQDNPVVTLNDLNLGNNFTIELGFKTYNISDESKPILTIGNMQLRPTQFCWNVDSESSNADSTFNARNSIFQEDVKTHVLVTVTKDFTISKGDTYYPDYLGSFQDTFDNNMTSSTYSGKNKFNLVRVFINDVIDREYIITDEELNTLKTSNLVINPTTADIDFYLVRIYNQTALDFDQIQQNYISFLTNDVTVDGDDPKTEFYEKNDILDNDGEISFTKAYQKYNSIVLVFPQDPTDTTRTNYVPSRAWGGKDNSDPTPNDNLPTTMFINYADSSINKTYGGRVTNLRVRGQGTSAMRYYIWNVATHFTKAKQYVTNEDGTLDLSKTEKANSKFTPYSNLDGDTNRFVSDPSNVVKKGYYMPPYSGRQSSSEILVKKAVGKVNYASSMQSHKIGFTKMYDDFYQSKVGALPTGGRKAVQEEPFLYFYVNANQYDVSKVELSDLLAADAGTSTIFNDKLKFMGFLTWGSAKGDDQTSGYSDDTTPGYLMLEGGENGDISVNFRCPWQALQRNPVSWTDVANSSLASTQTLADVPQITYDESLEKPWEHLWISGDESIIYDPNTADVTGAWDVDYGLEEVTDDSGITLGFRLNVGSDEEPNKYLRQSVKTWREFYDFVYTHDYNIVETKNSDTSTWTDTNHKYVCTASTCTASTTHKANDVYRYNKLTGEWIPAGVSYVDGKWSSFNLVSDVGTSSVNTIAKAKAELKKQFTEGITWNSTDAANSGTLDAVDAAVHQAMIRFVSGTDNRAKNTYFRITGPLLTENTTVNEETQEETTTYDEPKDYATNPRKYHYVGFLQDDVDTILATDNNGLQTKQYNILEPSYRESDSQYWGDSGSNAFFYMFDQCFESSINTWLSSIIDFVLPNPDVENTSNKFYQYFFKVQDDYPAVAYNHTAKIYYELGQLVLNVGAIPNFSSNDQQPIQQSHGSCINSEKNYMSKRLIFLGSQVANSTIGGIGNLSVNPGSGTGGSTKAIKIKMDFSPYQDMYPLFRYTGIDYIYSNGESSDPSAIQHLTEAGKDYSVVINRTADSVNNNISLINYYKKLTLTGLESSSLGSVDYDRAVEFRIDNSDSSYATSNFTDSAIPNFPVVEDFTLANMELPATFDASNFDKLKTLNLSQTTTKYVILPATGRLQTVVLPETIETFKIFNNPGLLVATENEGTYTGINFEGLSNLKTVEIVCDKVGNFELNNFCEQLINCSNLTSVSLKNADLYITEDAILKLANTNNLTLTGKVHIVSEAGTTTLATISFATKQALVNLFGNIDDDSNSLRVYYTSEEITEFSCASEVSVYYQTGESGTIVRPNMFNITVSEGNNIAIAKNSSTGAYYPNITYTMSGVSSSIASIDKYTGAITLKQESSSTAKVTITLVTTTTTLTKTVTVSFAWKAPSIGDFAYADGTFTSSYDSNKTMIGLVYAKDETTTTSGTVYIVGKEYASDTSYYLGYSEEGTASSDIQMLTYAYQVGQYLSNNSITNYDTLSDIAEQTLLNDITVSNYTVSTNTEFSGKSDTAIYKERVDTVILPILYRNAACKPYIKYSNSSYYIDSIEDLNSLITAMKSVYSNLSSTDVLSVLLYPYFYSMALYEPAVNNGETINSAYAKGNWYAPSVAEWSRIIYYRGYSAKGSSFNASQYIYENVSTSISSSGGVLTTPIFSLALKSAGNKFPTVWSALGGSEHNSGVNNIPTTVNQSYNQNYSYQCVGRYSNSSYEYPYQWIYGAQTDPTGWSITPAYNNAWRYTKHQGIPFTQFNYSKND